MKPMDVPLAWSSAEFLIRHGTAQILGQQADGFATIELMPDGGLGPHPLVQVACQAGVAEVFRLILSVADRAEEARGGLAEGLIEIKGLARHI